MQILKHPTFADVQQEVADENVERWLAAGWKHLLTKKQRKRYDEIESDVKVEPVRDDLVFDPGSQDS